MAFANNIRNTLNKLEEKHPTLGSGVWLLYGLSLAFTVVMGFSQILLFLFAPTHSFSDLLFGVALIGLCHFLTSVD